MATTQNNFTGDGSSVLFSFTFPYLDESHIKVSLNGSDTTLYTLANATTIQMNTAPANGVAIRVYRETELVDLSSTFFAGSAIRSQDLNDNFLQSLYLTQETRDITVEASDGNIPDGSIGSSKLADGAITTPKILDGAVIASKMAVNSVATASIQDSAVTTAKIAALAVTSASLADDAVTNAKIADTAVNTAQLASSAVTTDKLADSSVTQAKIGTNVLTPRVSEINGGPLAGFRNAIINGGMQVAQRTAPTITATPQYGRADRFIAFVSGGTGISGTINQSADAQFKSGYRLWLASLSYTSGTWAIQQRIESFNSIGLNGSTVTVSFKVYHDFGSSRPVTVSLAKANAVDGFSSVTAIASTYTSPALTSGAYSVVSCSFVIGASDATNGILLQINDSSATTVSAKNVIIGDIQLEIGPVATAFESRPIGTELALCQRYYYQPTDTNRVMFKHNQIGGLGRDLIGPSHFFPVVMRVAPTITYTDNVGNASRWTVGTANNISPGVGGPVSQTTCIRCDLSFGSIAQDGLAAEARNFTASAEL
jgi:hypothetical protein